MSKMYTVNQWEKLMIVATIEEIQLLNTAHTIFINAHNASHAAQSVADQLYGSWQKYEKAIDTVYKALQAEKLAFQAYASTCDHVVAQCEARLCGALN